MNFQKIKGLIAATFTPFLSNGEINYDLIPAYAEFLKKNGVAGVFVAGTTGEGLSLTLEERKKLTEGWMPFQDSNFKIIVHVGANALKECQELTAHAAKLDLDGIGMTLPGFFKPATPKDLINSLATVASKAPTLPFYYYHLPSMTGIHLPMVSFLKEAIQHIPNFAGVKFTHSNLMEFQLCRLLENEKLDLLFGRDEELLAVLSFGCKGAVGSTYNYMTGVYLNVIKAVELGNLNDAQEWQNKAIKLVEILIKYGGGVSCGKAIMAMTMNADFGKCRLPVSSLDESAQNNLKQDLSRIGYFDFCNEIV